MIEWDQRRWAEMRRRLQRLAASYPGAAEQAGATVGQQLLSDAINMPPTVPVRTGRLRESGTFEVSGEAGTCRVIVGFHTPYAARVHQVPMAFREPSAGNYYLSSKLMRFREQYLRIFARRLAAAQGMG